MPIMAEDLDNGWTFHAEDRDDRYAGYWTHKDIVDKYGLPIHWLAMNHRPHNRAERRQAGITLPIAQLEWFEQYVKEVSDDQREVQQPVVEKLGIGGF